MLQLEWEEIFSKGCRDFTEYSGEQPAGAEAATPTSRVRAASKSVAPSTVEAADALSFIQSPSQSKAGRML